MIPFPLTSHCFKDFCAITTLPVNRTDFLLFLFEGLKSMKRRITEDFSLKLLVFFLPLFLLFLSFPGFIALCIIQSVTARTRHSIWHQHTNALAGVPFFLVYGQENLRKKTNRKILRRVDVTLLCHPKEAQIHFHWLFH